MIFEDCCALCTLHGELPCPSVTTPLPGRHLVLQISTAACWQLTHTSPIDHIKRPCEQRSVWHKYLCISEHGTVVQGSWLYFRSLISGQLCSDKVIRSSVWERVVVVRFRPLDGKNIYHPMFSAYTGDTHFPLPRCSSLVGSRHFPQSVSTER